ncbi:ankyrin repeat-containing domain protein [Microdochium trichocladiopsis]|uniref:Ankyrin repeat-containing domain protein n=1 Tax=Microdochium trichocladiopsis TaxID=1682393 RepID=A0A9P8Y8I3_9PEZI|nr:ankyrin repeat-containing domain protein [Microdochium trichocladiopsis]KAH7032661.1 ankyrin repeat-containing domain protein [Microdochium trichocladiopsis]
MAAAQASFRCWSALPTELLRLIANNLSSRDALAFAATDHFHHEVLDEWAWARHIRSEDDPHRYRPLWWAASQTASHPCALRTAERALRLGADPNACVEEKPGERQPQDGKTPLLLAVQSDAAAMVQLLLAHGADPSLPGPWFTPPVTAAASEGKLVALKALLAWAVENERTHIFDTDSDPAGNTAIGAAAVMGQDDAVRMLLDHGVPVDLRVSTGTNSHMGMGDGCTALSLALSIGRRSTVALLLDAGADLLLVDDQGATVLDKGVEMAASGTIKGLRDKEARFAAALDLLRYVLEVQRQRCQAADARINEQEGLVWLGMTQAQVYRLLLPSRLSANVLRVLIEAGIPVDTQCPRHGTTLLWEIAGNDGPTMSLSGMQKTRADMARLLIDAGADVNVLGHKPGGWPMDNSRKTPLGRAIQAGFRDVIVLLLSRGADVTLKDAKGRGALATAVSRPMPGLLQLLLDHGRQPDGSLSPVMKEQLELRDNLGRTPLLLAATVRGEGAVRPMQILLENGAKVDVQDRYGGTPLYHAVSNKYMVHLLPALAAKGARIDTQDPNRSLLLSAVRNGAHEAVPVLVALGADVDLVRTLPDGLSLTPLVEAVHGADLQGAEALLKAGASLRKAFQCDPGLLDCCRKQGDSAMADLLLAHGAAEWDSGTAVTIARFLRPVGRR